MDRISELDAAYEKLRLARRETPGGRERFGVMRGAISMAVQDEARDRGIPFESSAQLGKHVDRYTEALNHIVNNKRLSQHPRVASVARAAQSIEPPVEDDPGRLTNTATPTPRALAALIRKNGLLDLADVYLSKKYKGHVPFAHYNPKIIKRPSGFVELSPDEQTHLPTPAEVEHAISQHNPATIKPATDETVPLASLSPAAKKARRLRDNAETELPLPLSDDGQPLPLANVPEDMPGVRNRDRHSFIASMVLQQKPANEIVTQIASRFAISPRAARATFRRWLDLSRKGLAKLARKGQYDPAHPTTVTDLYAGVDPHIAGTRLAMHLIQLAKQHAPGTTGAADEGATRDPSIHTLAKAALAGTGLKGANGDVYAALGERLARIGHPLAKTYNWHTMDRSMGEDAFMRKFLAKHVRRPEGMGDREFYNRALRSFDLNLVGKEHGIASPENARRFWARALDEYSRHPLGLRETGDTGNYRGMKRREIAERLLNAMHRLHTLVDDRELSASIDAKKERAGSANDWRKLMGQEWANEHMRFARHAPDAGDAAVAGILRLVRGSSRA